jgi:hypothetical protein
MTLVVMPQFPGANSGRNISFEMQREPNTYGAGRRAAIDKT